MKQLNNYRVFKYDVYFYTFRNTYMAKARVYKGHVWVRKVSDSNFFNPVFKANNNSFRAVCKAEEEILWHNSFWLSKRDDEKAFKIFEKHINKLIEKEKKKIKNYKEHLKYISSNSIEDFIKEN